MSRRRRAQKAEPVPPAGGTGGRGRAVAVVAALALMGVAWLVWDRARGRPLGRDSLLLITLDTTRADHLGAYGYAKARTPQLDRLFAEGARFERALTAAPLTLPAHASIFTGRYPFHHGVRDNGTFFLAADAPTLATALKAAGYRTAAFVSAFVLDRRFGLARGFDLYDDRMEGFGHVMRVTAERRGDRTVAGLKAWLESYAPARTEPFFLWLHLYDPHDPYDPPAPYAAAFTDRPYDGEIAYVDSLVGDVRATLERLGLARDTVVAIAGDHGEDLGEHGEETHGLFLYDATLRVPLALWRPGRVSPAVVKDLARTVDLAPTLLELLGQPPLPQTDGRSLLELLRGGRQPPAPAYAETLYPELDFNWSALRCVSDERYKLIEAPRPELYDLQSDPGERADVGTAQPQRAEALRQALGRLGASGPGAMSRAAPDRDASERLAALGYVAAGSGAAAPGSSHRDPKDMAAVYRRWRGASSALTAGHNEEAARGFTAILAEDPENVQALFGLGNALASTAQVDGAIDAFRRFLKLVPGSAQGHQSLAICFTKKKDYDAAMQETEAALLVDARFTDARLMRAEILRERGDREGARAEMKAALAVDPENPAVRIQQARHLAHDGKLGDAESLLYGVLKDYPGLPQAQSELTRVQARSSVPRRPAG